MCSCWPRKRPVRRIVQLRSSSQNKHIWTHSCAPCWQTIRMIWRKPLRHAFLTLGKFYVPVVNKIKTFPFHDDVLRDLTACTHSRPCGSEVPELIIYSWIGYPLWRRGRWASWRTHHRVLETPADSWRWTAALLCWQSCRQIMGWDGKEGDICWWNALSTFSASQDNTVGYRPQQFW